MQVVYRPKALKDLKAITKVYRQRIYVKIEQYADSPSTLGNQVKQLTNSPFYRLRVGDYRVFFTLEDGIVSIMNISRVLHRREAYEHKH